VSADAGVRRVVHVRGGRPALRVTGSAGFGLAVVAAGAGMPRAGAGPLLLGVADVAGLAGVALLAGACAVAGGAALAALLTRAGVRGPVVVPPVLAATAAGVPLAVADPSGFCGLALVAVAVSGALRFALDGDTYGGFVAGLALAAAFTADPRAAIAVPVVVIAAAVLARLRRPRDRGIGRATATVLAFPVLVTVLSWLFLTWRLTGDPAWPGVT
jgi:hypothetical protein